MKKKYKLACFLAIMLVFVCFLSNATATATASERIISWGLKSNYHERTPVPPDGSIAMLEENNGLFVGDTEVKNVYLTFDLGYEAGYTAKVLDILRDSNIKAIFFLCGNYLKEEELVNRMIAEGQYIGNHTDKHKDLPLLSEEEIKKDIVSFQEKFNAKYSKDAPIKFFRPPQGRFSAKVLKAASGEGLKTALWSIAIVDWNKTPINAAESADKIESRLHPGAIVLSHITNSGTVEMLKLLIPKISAKGYQIGDPQLLLNKNVHSFNS